MGLLSGRLGLKKLTFLQERHDPALLFPATAHQKKAVNKKDRVICGVLLNRDAPLPSRHGWLQLVFVPAELLRAYGPFPQRFVSTRRGLFNHTRPVIKAVVRTMNFMRLCVSAGTRHITG
jgi:hypothetical protein